ncbi:cholinesterase 1 [Rhipicephalus sanguineus]|nr:cholinesterase 1 [Rhipicephalus sanguineus]
MSHIAMHASLFLVVVALSAVAHGRSVPSENDIFSDAPVVCFRTGCTRGTRQTVNDQTVNEFYGIPYAMAPVGDLRFKKPVPHYDWGTGIYNATIRPPSCPQTYFYADDRWNNYDLSLNEDCLFLNVWAPEPCREDIKCSRRPVVVFIHGGGFTHGGSERASADMSHLAAVADVVAVSFNYRLNGLGFMYGRSKDLPANLGLFDQRLAMNWVRDNVEFFGGDPDSITLMGHDAGAQSVGYHMLSPKSRVLFKRAVLLGGNPYSSTPLNKPDMAYNRALAVTRKLGCLDSEQDLRRNPGGVMQCLKSKDASEIAHSSEYEFSRGRISLFPVFGDEFLPKSPQEMMADAGSFKGTDVLMGLTEEEAAALVYYGGYFDGAPPDDITMGDVRYVVGLYFGMMYKRNASPIMNYYLNETEESPSDSLKAGGRAIGDGVTLCPGNQFGEDLARRGANVYYFMLTQESSFGSQLFGPTYGEDMLYMLGSMNDMSKSDEEKLLSEKIMKMLGRFARTGRPDMPTMISSWPQFSEESPYYLSISARNASVQVGPRLEECNFWKNFWRLRGGNGASQDIVIG